MTPETGPQGRSPLLSPRLASTEPGPDDPGDTKLSARSETKRSGLQRSRGRMTPETPAG